jgi:hypothetical protein
MKLAEKKYTKKFRKKNSDCRGPQFKSIYFILENFLSVNTDSNQSILFLKTFYKCTNNVSHASGIIRLAPTRIGFVVDMFF